MTENWTWPQWIAAGIMALEVLGALVLNGKPRGAWSFGEKVVEISVWAILLFVGGFFR